jgi:hypothetical protein
MMEYFKIMELKKVNELKKYFESRGFEVIKGSTKGDWILMVFEKGNNTCLTKYRIVPEIAKSNDCGCIIDVLQKNHPDKSLPYYYIY